MEVGVVYRSSAVIKTQRTHMVSLSVPFSLSVPLTVSLTVFLHLSLSLCISSSLALALAHKGLLGSVVILQASHRWQRDKIRTQPIGSRLLHHLEKVPSTRTRKVEVRFLEIFCRILNQFDSNCCRSSSWWRYAYGAIEIALAN